VCKVSYGRFHMTREDAERARAELGSELERNACEVRAMYVTFAPADAP
jgi:hypothetical protein